MNIYRVSFDVEARDPDEVMAALYRDIYGVAKDVHIRLIEDPDESGIPLEEDADATTHR